MRLSCIGAAHEVTGSCHLLEACGKNILIDCGMEQGPDLYENQEIPVTAKEIDYILLTMRISIIPEDSASLQAGIQRRCCDDLRYFRFVQHHAARQRAHPGIRIRMEESQG